MVLKVKVHQAKDKGFVSAAMICFQHNFDEETAYVLLLHVPYIFVFKNKTNHPISSNHHHNATADKAIHYLK